ncbi:Protein of unknown function [Roseivivax lentus]|uniref:DUF1217 domain-containing protein n=1 Tax=Roseivivax lentus TaxID=633194 RepID=A0A1N7JL12_9RHOB|nr:DUF1217 domain-containing protein [Roseivivax lentus]SIS50000.1 Protein of unknown function [Roseivivax lentus]
MSFQPVVIGTGLAAWSFLKATRATQEAAFEASPQIARATANFAEKIAGITTAADLVADRELRLVALQAFGLQDDVDNVFFVQRILDGGTSEPDALANRLADDRYRAFSAAFGFGEPLPPRTANPSLARNIVDRFRAQSFELAIGSQNEALRLGLFFERSLPDLVAKGSANDTAWFEIMGTPPMRQVLETALGLPKSFGQLDIDFQLEAFKDKAHQRFGTHSVADLANPEIQEQIIQTFLLREQVNTGATTSGAQTALVLLQGL